MLSIFVCEDDQYFRQQISMCIQKHINMEELDVEFALCTSDPAQIIQHIKKNEVNGLYFLDIELEGGYNGVEVAKNIRQYDPRGFIVFITAHPRYMSLTFEYKVEALAYIHKEHTDNIQQRVCECVDDAYSKHVSRPYEGCFIFKTPSGRKISCLYSDILFFETDAPGTKRIIMHTHKRQYVFYGSLNDVVKSLPSGLFFQCHKSSVVNLKHISESCTHDLMQNKGYMTMSNGADCLVSSRKKNGLIKV